MIDQYDTREAYCRRLGHPVQFGYCRCAAGPCQQPGESVGPPAAQAPAHGPSGRRFLPCSRILDCWFDKLPVHEYLQLHYSPAELERAFAPPKPRIVQILEAVEEARRRCQPSPLPTGD